MKVVLFCGGKGMRIREYAQDMPKPMVPIGPRPIIWHIMKYYAHFGHREFILCLGHQGEQIKRYFLEYNECESNDFTLRDGGRRIDVHHRDINDWTITFVDTGQEALIGQRLRCVQRFVEDEELFLANYSDNVTDFDLPRLVDRVQSQPDVVGAFLKVRPPWSCHLVQTDRNDELNDILPVEQTEIWINGGYFALRPEIFDYLHEGEDLATDAFQRLAGERRALTVPHDGFWKSMDTFKERQQLEDLYHLGQRAWMVWEHDLPQAGGATVPAMPGEDGWLHQASHHA